MYYNIFVYPPHLRRKNEKTIFRVCQKQNVDAVQAVRPVSIKYIFDPSLPPAKHCSMSDECPESGTQVIVAKVVLSWKCQRTGSFLSETKITYNLAERTTRTTTGANLRAVARIERVDKTLENNTAAITRRLFI